MTRSFLAALVAPVLLATAVPAASQGACPGQELILFGLDGRVFRVDDYATSSPALVQIGDAGGTHEGAAIDPSTGLITSVWGTLFGTTVYAWDAQYNTTVVGSAGQTFLVALDYDASGTLWAASGLFTFIWHLDPTTAGLTTVASNTNVAADGDIAVAPDGIVYFPTFGGGLAVFDPATGTVTEAPHTGTQSAIEGFEIDCDGSAYMASHDGDFYHFDLNTRVATLVASFGLNVGDLSFTIPADINRLIGTSYCGPASSNSTGGAATMVVSGSENAADNQVTLGARGLPARSFGFFLTSRVQDMVPAFSGSQGTLCLGGALGRFNGLGQILNSGASGEFDLPLDLTQMPQPTGFVAVVAGETWNFQAWYRDANPGLTSNLTDGVSVLFQ